MTVFMIISTCITVVWLASVLLFTTLRDKKRERYKARMQLYKELIETVVNWNNFNQHFLESSKLDDKDKVYWEGKYNNTADILEIITNKQKADEIRKNLKIDWSDAE